MPQLDISHWGSQIFWLFLTFAMMYVLMSTLVIPRMRTIIDRREQKISGDLKRADELRIEAQKILEEYTSMIAKVKQEAHDGIAKATFDAETVSKKRLDLAVSEISDSTNKALSKIEEAKKDSLKEINSLSVEIADTIMTKTTGVKVNETDFKKALKLIK